MRVEKILDEILLFQDRIIVCRNNKVTIFLRIKVFWKILDPESGFIVFHILNNLHNMVP